MWNSADDGCVRRPVQHVSIRRFFRKKRHPENGPSPGERIHVKALSKVTSGEIDPRAIITHKLPLDEAAHAYHIFNDKQDDCIKVVLKP